MLKKRCSVKKILFVAYGGGHIKVIEPIAKELLDKSEIEFKILALTAAYKSVVDIFPDGVVKTISDYAFLFDDTIDEVLTLGLEFLEDNYTASKAVSKEETIYYIGLSFYDLIQKVGKDKAYQLYKEKKRQSFLPISIMEKILKHEEVDIVVSTTAPRFEQASFIAANNLNIETVEVLDLFANVYPLPEANHIIVMNKAVKNDFISMNLKNKKYHVLGQPAIENTLNIIKGINIDEKLRLLNLDENKRVLLFATQPLVIVDKDLKITSYIEYEKVYDELFELLHKISINNKINIIIRLHPNENKEDYYKYFNKYPNFKYCNEMLNIEESLAVSDFVLTIFSTVALQALVANKKVFTFKHKYSKFYSVPTFSRPPFIFSDGLKELEDNLYKYLDCQKDNIVVEEFLPKNSAKNIAKLIKEL